MPTQCRLGNFANKDGRKRAAAGCVDLYLEAWEQATGPKTKVGKVTVSRNHWRGSHRQKQRELASMLNVEIRQAQEMASRPCEPLPLGAGSGRDFESE